METLMSISRKDNNNIVKFIIAKIYPITESV